MWSIEKTTNKKQGPQASWATPPWKAAKTDGEKPFAASLASQSAGFQVGPANSALRVRCYQFE